MIYFSEWLAKDHPKLYAEITQVLDQYGEKHGLLPHTADYWCRDYMPIPLKDCSYLRYRYTPDYLVEDEDWEHITDPKPVCETLGLHCIDTDIVLDGGNVVRCGDKVVMIDKVFNENPQYEREELIAKLEALLGAQIVWLPWDRAEEYGHSDGVVRYIEGNKVLLTNYKDYDPKMHQLFYDELSKHFEVKELTYSLPNSKDHSWSYINFLQTAQVIILPKFGSHKDDEAFAQMRQHFPTYKDCIVQVDVREIVADGGAFNCISWLNTM